MTGRRISKQLVFPLFSLISMLVFTGCPGPEPVPVPVPPTPHDMKILAVAPVIQQTPEWCWAASAQMIFQYYDLPSVNPVSYQCGIVALYFGPNSSCYSDCYSCIIGISSLTEFQNLIDNYGIAVQQLGMNSRVLTSQVAFSALSLPYIGDEIGHGRLIFAGISPESFLLPNLPQHATVIVGYDATGPVPMIYVNDPWPYDLPIFGQTPNPYLNFGGYEVTPGQFKISLDAFVTNLQWGNTVYNIH